MELPKNLKYTKDHEWVDTSTSPVKVGVTSYAVDQLGDIVHIDLPNVGESFEGGGAFGTIESTKTVSDLYMPVSGKVAAINQDIVSGPESLADDPYEKGWLITVESSDGFSNLLDADAYEAFVKEQD